MNKKNVCARGVLCLGLLLAAPTHSARASSAAAEQLLSKARSLEGRGRLDLAARAWEQTLLAEPDNAEALLGLAKFAQQNGKLDEANRYLQRLRNIDPSNPSIGAVQGMSSAGKQRQGIEEATRLAANQNFEAAMRIYRSLFGNEPPAGGIAIGYYETLASTPGAWKDAVAGMQRLAEKYPQSQEYRLSLGRLKTYRQPTRFEGMEILASVQGDNQIQQQARAAWRQALIWSAGNPASAPSLQSYLSRYPDPELQKLAVPPPQTSVGAGTQAQAQQPSAINNTESGLGYKALELQRLPDAEKHFQSALAASPHNALPLAGLGYVRMKQEDFRSAAELFQQALESQPKNKSFIDALATARFWEQMKSGGDQLTLSRPDLAVTRFEKALALRPGSSQAAESLAAAYILNHQPSLAVAIYEKLQKLKPQDLGYWYGLVNAKYRSGNAADALADLKHAPPQIKEEWAKSPEHLALLSFLYAETGDLSQSKRMFDRAAATATGNKTEVPVHQQVEFAALFLHKGRARQAAEFFADIAAKHPSSVDAWAGCIGALSEMQDYARAYETLQRIPAKTYASAIKKPDFLRSVARLQSSMKRDDLAEASLAEAAKVDQGQGKSADLEGQLQLAGVWARTRRTAQAEKLLRTLVDDNPNNKNVWATLVAHLHESKADVAALAEIERMPESVALETHADPEFVALQANVYLGNGRKQSALSILRETRKRAQDSRQAPSVAQDIQLGWLLLDDPESDTELSNIFEGGISRQDLKPVERRDIEQVYSAWAQRRAQTAIENKDIPKALSILQKTAVLLPREPRLSAMIASTFLRGDNFEKAFEAYQRWGLTGANVEDFRGAVGAASAARQGATAAKWLDRGLKEFPGNPLLLQLAGEQAARNRDYKQAETYFRQALQKLSTETSSAPPEVSPAPPTAPSSPVPTFNSPVSDDALSTSDSSFATVGPPKKALVSINRLFGGAKALRVLAQNAPSVLDSRPGDTSDDSRAKLPDRSFADGRRTEPQTEASSAHAPVTQADARLKLKEEIQGELEAVEGRNTPYFHNGVNFQQRSGSGGFDRLLIEEAHLEASATIAERVRLTLLALPTYVDSGSPASSSNSGHLGFGTVAVNGTPGARSAFGIGGEAQLATANFGLRIGMSPAQFLVHGWTGGLRWNPAGGPITLRLEREPVRDTKLSFAGERDPDSQLVWGGAMANSLALIGNWSRGATGYYAKIGFQDIEGKRIAKNTRIEANVGSYFKVYRNRQGELTVGFNLTGQHYDKNLRYFTLGQGGYFSPQQYFLVNVPARWAGRVNRQLQYSISASLGVQHFTENASPYFPTDSARQAISNLYYPSYTNTGGNYNLRFDSIYQIAPQWLGGAFFDVNNARQYRSVNAGIFLKYLIKPRTSAADLNLRPVPDWTGASPFNLP